MKKILIISFYELKDYFLNIKKNFELHKFTVICYPLFRYAYDKHDKLDNYKDHLNDFIKEMDIDVILWWFIDVPCDVFAYVRDCNKERIFIMHNSNDPVNINEELFEKARGFDIVVSTCGEQLYKIRSDVETVLFGPLSWDTDVFGRVGEGKGYDCDISFIVNDLFFDEKRFGDQIVKQKKLIDDIILLCEEGGYKLNLYGSAIVKGMYPKYYKEMVGYGKLNNVFNRARINIVNSCSGKVNLCIGEHVMNILGSGSLLLHDRTLGIEGVLVDGENCVLYGRDGYIQIRLRIF